MFETKWALGATDAQAALALRKEVFVDECAQPYSDVFDDADLLCAHLGVFEGGVCVASGRFCAHEGGVLLERLCVKAPYRGQGFFDLMVRVMLDKARRMGTDFAQIVCEQAYVPYFTAFGFAPAAGADGALQALRVRPQDMVFPSSCGGHGN